MADDPKHVLERAKAAINQQDPHLALRHLRSIERLVEDLPGTPIWADHRITLAEAYSALNNDAASGFFEEALERLSEVDEHQASLELRANEHYADHLYRFAKRLSKARELFANAKPWATRIGKEDTARVQMKIIGIDLQVDNDPELENFQTLRRVARQRHATCQTQLAVWMQHLGQQDRASRGLRAARNRCLASEQYFADLIFSIKDSLE